MALKRTTRANPATTTTTTTTSVTDAQLEALIEQGVARALAARDTDIKTHGDDSYNSGTSARKTERVTRECTYPDFMKCKPLNFKGTKGVVGLTYSQRFQELALMCDRMFPGEIDKVKKDVDGLPDTIHVSSPAATNNHRNPTCYECRNQGHYRIDCPKLKNQDHENQAGGTGAHGMEHALEGGETNQDLNDVEDDINA
nr:hypothetical protein [Tanacetum cinerariifolium]